MPPDSSPEKEFEDVKSDKTDATAQEVTKDGQDPAESSPAEDKGAKGDMLSAVKAALEPKAEKTPASDEPGSKSEEDPAKDAKKDGAEAGTESDDLTEDELAQVSKKTRKRIETLVRERTDRDRQIVELQPKAEQFEKITRFVDDAGLSKDEVNQGFAIMADLKTRPDQAYERLKPIMKQLAAMFGEGDLPDDLQQDVNFGRITEARARELVVARSRSTISNETLQRTEDQQRQQREAADHKANVDDVSNAVSDWERSKEKSDPSWKLKQPRVMELVELEIVRRQRTKPEYFPTKAEALEFSKAALEKVEKEFKSLAPRPKAINASPDAGSTRSTAAPKTMLEAARVGLANAAG